MLCSTNNCQHVKVKALTSRQLQGGGKFQVSQCDHRTSARKLDRRKSESTKSSTEFERGLLDLSDVLEVKVDLHGLPERHKLGFELQGRFGFVNRSLLEQDS
jgi:hypothetical protein